MIAPVVPLASRPASTLVVRPVRVERLGVGTRSALSWRIAQCLVSLAV